MTVCSPSSYIFKLLIIHHRTNNTCATESDASSTTSSVAEESLADRITALKDIIPARRRAQISNTLSTGQDWVSTGLTYTGKTLWVVCTSALLLGVPFMLAYADDQQMEEAEQQMKMQQTASEVSFG
jgi:import receptor subunit TOM22